MSSIPLKTRLSDAVKDAMRARDAQRLSTLRFLVAAVKQKEVDERRELSDAEVTAIIEKQVKQRRESIAAFEQAGRLETAAQETAELDVLREFLPQAATPEEIDAAIAAAMAELAASQGALNGVLGRLMAVAEAYPDLKANQNMMQLSEELTSTENRVAFARQAYNDAVMAYNNKREMFPSSVVAGMFNFAPAALLEPPAERAAQVREAPRVQF